MKLITIHTEKRCLRNKELQSIKLIENEHVYTILHEKTANKYSSLVSVNNQHVDLMDVIERAHAQ